VRILAEHIRQFRAPPLRVVTRLGRSAGFQPRFDVQRARRLPRTQGPAMVCVEQTVSHGVRLTTPKIMEESLHLVQKAVILSLRGYGQTRVYSRGQIGLLAFAVGK